LERRTFPITLSDVGESGKTPQRVQDTDEKATGHLHMDSLIPARHPLAPKQTGNAIGFRGEHL
jgi:hypothetical protein